MNCSINRLPSSTTFHALEEIQYYGIENACFDELLLAVPAYVPYFRILRQHACIREQVRVQEAISLSATERYVSLIGRYPDLEQRVSQKHIASCVDISPEFLSALKRDLIRTDS